MAKSSYGWSPLQLHLEIEIKKNTTHQLVRTEIIHHIDTSFGQEFVVNKYIRAGAPDWFSESQGGGYGALRTVWYPDGRGGVRGLGCKVCDIRPQHRFTPGGATVACDQQHLVLCESWHHIPTTEWVLIITHFLLSGHILETNLKKMLL